MSRVRAGGVGWGGWGVKCFLGVFLFCVFFVFLGVFCFFGCFWFVGVKSFWFCVVFGCFVVMGSKAVFFGLFSRLQWVWIIGFKANS